MDLIRFGSATVFRKYQNGKLSVYAFATMMKPSNFFGRLSLFLKSAGFIVWETFPFIRVLDSFFERLSLFEECWPHSLEYVPFIKVPGSF